MSKAIEGAAMLGGAVVLGAAAFLDPALVATGWWEKAMASLVMGGISMEAGAIAEALTQNRGMNITTRQPASFRQIVYGEQRVGGVVVYRSTTGSHHDQYNYVIVLAGHQIDSIVNLYLDGRQVFWQQGSVGNVTRNGVNFGGSADGNDHIGPNGQHYNFGTLVYCEARFGDQASGDVIGGLTANDPNWAASSQGSPYLGGCAYVYLKVEHDNTMFPGEPEIRFTIRGKNNIYDPRTGTTGYSSNWALCVADVLTDTEFGLGDTGSVNQAQLIAAANVCDEQVQLASGQTEARYALHYHYDTSVAPGDVLQQMMSAAAGRLSRIGGEWYIWPAYWQGPSFAFNQDALVDKISWMPKRAFSELFNRVTGTYIAPNFPYNIAGNLYDSNGWYAGQIQNNFPFAFQPTNYPQYACDTLHGYAADQYLAEDGGIPLPKEITQSCVLSVSQAQRCAKIYLMRNRQQGRGTLPMSLLGWQAQPTDVIAFSFPVMGWNSKVLEVDAVRFKADKQGENSSPRLYVELDVIETDPSVYEWSAAEELTVYDVPASPQQAPYTPAPPTNMTLDSGADTALVSVDGIVTPRVLVSWTAPLDVLVTQIQIQYRPSGTTTWVDAGQADVANFQAYVSGGLIANQNYDFRIRSLRANGAASVWVEIDGYKVSTIASDIASSTMFNGLGWTVVQGVIINYTFTNSSVQFTWDAQSLLLADGTSINLPAGSLSYTDLSPSTTYYTYWCEGLTMTRQGLVTHVFPNLFVTNPDPPPTSPNATMAAQMALDGRVPIGVISFTTLASSNSGSGSGTGGGGNVCPEAAERVDVRGKGATLAGDVLPGDYLRGYSFRTGMDVYRRVIQVRRVSCSTWRIVDGHRVSPCEPVYQNGKWIPAYRADGAKLDTMAGIKIFISIESDEYDEQNFWLVDGPPLLIHNYNIMPNPC
ncbi:MAG TPA: hypothetical protein VKX41_15065 [Alloacidobacterium sp.]|jgi:hypothetical protein|nr:hypothetical protein [Alloacidobacterium sp.]